MTICSLIHQAIEVTRLLAAFILKYSLDGSNLKKKNWLKKVYIYIYILKNGDTDAQLKKTKVKTLDLKTCIITGTEFFQDKLKNGWLNCFLFKIADFKK